MRNRMYNGYAFGSFVMIMLILALATPLSIHEAFGTSSFAVIGDINLQDIAAVEITHPIINSNLFFSLTLSNGLDSPQPYVVVFDVRDSDDYSVATKFQEGRLLGHSAISVREKWLPDEPGNYSIRVFIISNLDSPRVLSEPISKHFEVFVSKPKIKPEKSIESPAVITVPAETPPSIDELKQFAVDRINTDRAKYGLSPVKLSTNTAAQVHAEDVFKTRIISHWMTNGEKPYMTYSRYGGLGAVSQNVAISGHTESYEECVSESILCAKIDPKQSIDRLQRSMVYDDLECCQDGHRMNILDKHHTHVSIGLAYDDYFLVIVQNFENQYITFETPLLDGNNIRINGKISHKLSIPIVVHKDPPLSPEQYRLHRDDNSYGIGEAFLCIAAASGADSGLHCYNGNEEIKTYFAGFWTVLGREDGLLLDILLPIRDIAPEPGVYTIIVYLENQDHEEFEALTYSYVR